MAKKTVLYSLQLHPVGEPTGSKEEFTALELVALPKDADAEDSKEIRVRFRHWQPLLERIFSLISSSPFHRKAVYRTLAAGVPAHLIDRSDGSHHLFSPEQLAELHVGADETMTSAA